MRLPFVSRYFAKALGSGVIRTPRKVVAQNHRVLRGAVQRGGVIFIVAVLRLRTIFWETDFHTPPVLGGAALLPFSAPAVYKNQGP